MYQLAPHVFACSTGRNCMFLDLRQDSYLSVPQALMASVAPNIHGWQLPAGTHEQRRPSERDATQLTEDLLAAGILCPFHDGSDAPPQPPAPATRDFTSLGDSNSNACVTGQWAGTLAALAWADCALRLLPLWRIVKRVSTFHPCANTHVRPELLPTAAAYARCFRAIRPWYPRNYLCLFDSLALTLFLLRRGIPARCVFGVREDPFAAHCWVQYGGVVLNEYLDRARLYNPIMAV